ncbi:MAG TPA: carboxypeptidase-like regulatory domain-containing protein, partial [Mucilaginibacter sp.]
MKKNLYVHQIAVLLQIATLSVLLLLLYISTATAQGGTSIVIKGKVTDAKTNETLPTVTVREKGTSNAVVTDVNGLYSITAGSTSTLVFSSVGYTSTEVAVAGKTEINVKLQPSEKELKDVVITALGIKRERRALGYSVTEVPGASLTEA